MSYTIIKSDGTLLTTIADGTINTTSTSLGLPGRNYPGYGRAQDINFVHLTENFADTTPPPNPLRGQLWFNTTNSTLYVCPTDGEANAAAWSAINTISSGGNSTFGSLTVTGNITATNAHISNEITANSITTNFLTVTANTTMLDANIATANIGTLRTNAISAGSTGSSGTLTGTWTINGTVGGNAAIINGNLFIPNIGGGSYGIKTDNYMYANGTPINIGGSYGNSNVRALLKVYNENFLASSVQTPVITTGSAATPGTITGTWSLGSGSRLQATYADVAERYKADAVYEEGTIVEIGGNHEVTLAKDELSDNVFGVVSASYGFLLNSELPVELTTDNPPIALIGRVNIKVQGPVTKGQRLVCAGNGIARGATDNDQITAFNVVGRALVDKNSNDVELVESVVLMVR